MLRLLGRLSSIRWRLRHRVGLHLLMRLSLRGHLIWQRLRMGRHRMRLLLLLLHTGMRLSGLRHALTVGLGLALRVCMLDIARQGRLLLRGIVGSASSIPRARGGVSGGGIAIRRGCSRDSGSGGWGC